MQHEGEIKGTEKKKGRERRRQRQRERERETDSTRCTFASLQVVMHSREQERKV